MRERFRCFAISTSIASACGAIHAAEYHVATAAPSAADSNPGTLAQPWKTIAKAAATAQAGDTVFIHAGTYPEAVKVRNSGTSEKPITFRAFEDDAVLLDGADTIPPENWRLQPNSRNIYALPTPGDPTQIFVDQVPVWVKVDFVSRIYPRSYKLGILGEADKNLYQYDSTSRQLLLNLGGDSPAIHIIRVPSRSGAFNLTAHCILAGIHAREYLGTAIQVGGDDCIVEDCLVTDSRNGIGVDGWDRRGAILRRNTIIGILGDGIFLADRPIQCLVEDNLVIRAALNPTRSLTWAGSVKMNSASDIIFANNVVLQGGNHETDGGDGAGLWGDGNIARVMFLGNTCANNKWAGIFVEFGMDDTRAYFNTSFRNDVGIVCRASQRGVFMRNVILESPGFGLAIRSAPAPYSTTDNVFAHNLVRGCAPSIYMSTEQPNFADYNTYWPVGGGRVAEGEAGKPYNGLSDWVRATGHDIHSSVRDAQPADVGLDTVTFRVAAAKDPAQQLMMVGNGGCEYEDPADQTFLPYFWRPGTGDGAAHVFVYAGYTGLEGGVDSFAFRGSGATLAFGMDTDPKQPKFAHGGLRYLKLNGQRPAEMCPDGLGYWSPSLPCRPGDVYDVSFYTRGDSLKPSGATALAAFAEFTDATGQHRQRQNLAPAQPLSGSSGWTRISSAPQAPAGATRMRVFLGLAPATGSLLLDDIGIKVR
jgi:hypothetical protein